MAEALLVALFLACLALALGLGFLAHYARDVRRNPRTTRAFALLGAAAALAAVLLGVRLAGD